MHNIGKNHKTPQEFPKILIASFLILRHFNLLNHSFLLHHLLLLWIGFEIFIPDWKTFNFIQMNFLLFWMFNVNWIHILIIKLFQLHLNTLAIFFQHFNFVHQCQKNKLRSFFNFLLVYLLKLLQCVAHSEDKFVIYPSGINLQ